MTNKQELNEKEINQVTGGKTFADCYLIYNNEIDKYETEKHIGEDALISGAGEWIIGTILKSFEKTADCGTKRTATIFIKESSNNIVGLEKDICLDYRRIYIK